MFIINYRKIFYTISGLFVVASIFAVIFFGLNFGIDFTGGSLMEVDYTNARPNITEVENSISKLGFGEVVVQPTGEKGYIIRTKSLEDNEHLPVLNALKIDGKYDLIEKRFNTIGPVIGEELKKKAWLALVVVVLAIIIFIAFVFRKVSQPVSSWKYGLVAIIALAHDIIIPTGIFALLGSRFVEFQIDILFVMALLAILGFSVNDTIVVFDRIRENLRKNREYREREDFDVTVGSSLTQTYSRSLNTSLTTLVVLVALYIFGGSSTQQFALVLSIGVIAGTYSSIFLASPLLVTLEKFQNRLK
jgi:preprotein translocase subunit SecF